MIWNTIINSGFKTALRWHVVKDIESFLKVAKALVRTHEIINSSQILTFAEANLPENKRVTNGSSENLRAIL